MIPNFYKKITGFFISISIIGSFALPQIALATLPVADVANTVQNTVSATANTTSAASTLSMQIKEYFLDNVAYMIAKMALRELTGSVVNWINSGFEGNPAFVSNPAEFFKDVGDQLLGEMIIGQENLAFLCSPFSIDLRLQLAFKYRPFQKRISCTLSDVISNVTGAVEGASINGFTAGDFSQGGWPAFVTMTTEPQNNLYGAYVQADFELSARIADMKKLKSDELNQGRGFLSWKKCTDIAAPGDANFVGPTQPGEGSSNLTSNTVGPEEANSFKRQQNCEVQTPGSVIAGVLDANAAGPLQELHLADEINEVVSALFSQMVKQILTTGLKSVSGSGPGDPDSYIKKMQDEQVQNNQQLQTIKTNVLRNIDDYIKKELDFKATKNKTLNSYLDVKNKYDIAKMCYITKQQIDNLSEEQIAYANQRIGLIEATIQNKLSASSTSLLGEVADADKNITDLRSIKERTNRATTVNEVVAPSQEYAILISYMHTDRDIVAAVAENDQVANTLDSLNRSGDVFINACNLFPGNIR